MNGHSMASAYLGRLDAFRQTDREREEMVADLVRKLDELETKYREKTDDYNNEVESRRMWQNRSTTAERTLVEMKQASGSGPFAMAILDGDGAIFQDYLYAQGKDGGSDAAHQLHTEMRNQLKTIYPEDNVNDWNIVVNVILNLEGLGKKLQAVGVISNYNELPAFGRAFGLAQPLFHFTDVGNGKERADHKIRETLRLYLKVEQCKHIFFGPCNDNGYLPFLEPFKRDPSIASRLSLVETRPAEYGFQNLGFRMTTFPTVFRIDNLPNRPNNFTNGMITPPLANMPLRSISNMPTQAGAPSTPASYKAPPKPASPAPSTESAASGSTSTWATVGKSAGGGGVKTINIASAKAPARKHILLNAYDQRLDTELPRMDPTAEKRFRERIDQHGKCCNEFHLKGKCPAGEYCDYYHGDRLSPGEQLVLVHKARGRSCPDRSMCRNFSCTFGHQCPGRGKRCFMGDDCWFADMHELNVEPAKRMFEDGSEEWNPAYIEKAKMRK